jgi:hypothetical protein
VAQHDHLKEAFGYTARIYEEHVAHLLKAAYRCCLTSL